MEICIFSGISGGVRRISPKLISEKAFTSPSLIKRSVENESKLELKKCDVICDATLLNCYY